MATNDFQVWAGASGANVLTQAQYLALTDLTTGVIKGLASATQANKTWRQASVIAAVIGQLIADVTGQNATDDGTTATLEANLLALIRGSGGLFVTDAGAVNALSVTLAPAPPSLASLVGIPLLVKVLNSNTGTSTIAVNGFAATVIHQDGIALSGGELVAGSEATFVYDGTVFQLLAKSAGKINVTAGTVNDHAVNLGQMNAAIAAVPGGATGANPTASVGATAVNGTASTFMRSDAAPPLGAGAAVANIGYTPYNSTNPAGYIAGNSLFLNAHDVSASRSPGVVYTNTTGKPMFVNIAPSLAAATMTVGGVTVSNSYQNAIYVFMVPPGVTYEMSGGVVGQWLEFY